MVVTPTDRHLREIVAPLQLLAVAPTKSRRLDDQLGPHFDLADHASTEFALALPPADLERLVLMGPNAFHTDPTALRDRIAALPSPAPVTASVTIAADRPRAG